MGFKVLESGIESDISMSSYTEISMEQFVEESIGMAKLIFTSTSGYNRVTKLFGKANVKMDITDSSQLRNMKPIDIFVTSDESFMRAHDYRATDGNSGIALFIDKPLSCRRTFLQALGRVGRYGQVCRRFVREGLEIIDKVEYAKVKLCIANKIKLVLDQKADARA